MNGVGVHRGGELDGYVVMEIYIHFAVLSTRGMTTGSIHSAI
jgi:hypothetical protein